MDCLFNVTIGGGYFPNDGSAPADGGVMPKFTPTWFPKITPTSVTKTPLKGVLLHLQQVQFGTIPSYVSKTDRMFPFEETGAGTLD